MSKQETVTNIIAIIIKELNQTEAIFFNERIPQNSNRYKNQINQESY